MYKQTENNQKTNSVFAGYVFKKIFGLKKILDINLLLH